MQTSTLHTRASAHIIVACFAVFSCTAFAQTKVFFDTFSGSSSINSNPAAPAEPSFDSAAYQQICEKSTANSPSAMVSGTMSFGMNATTSGASNVLGLFTKYPVRLANDNEYIELTVTFSSAGGILTASNKSLFGIGLYNAAQTQPYPGGIVNSTAGVAGYAQGWLGYAYRLYSQSADEKNGFYSRAAQTASATNNQNVIYRTTADVGGSIITTMGAITGNTPYTLVIRITKAGASSLALSSSFYAGATATGTPINTFSTTTASILTDTFDALSIGYFATANVTSTASITSVKVVTTGQCTVVPQIITQPLTLTKSVGDSFSLSVDADGGNGPAAALSYQWKKGGTAIPGAQSDSLAFTSVTSADAGDYTVVITNDAGTVTSETATLTVTTGAVAPQITAQPSGATIDAGESHTFSVTANGTAPLAYQWQKSTDGGAIYTDVGGATSAAYTVSNATTAHTALYRVVVSNGVPPDATSNAVQLTVQVAPQITAQPTGGNYAPGAPITLSITAAGTPAPTYQWKKNGVVIDGATSATYSIASATGADTGNYTCVVTNDADTITSAVAPVAVLSSSLAATAHAPGATAVNPDARLAITFNEVVAAGVSGYLRIHDASTNNVVDTIDLAAATALRDTLRAANALSAQLLPVQKQPIGGITNDFNYYPLTISADGKTVTIHPRNGALARGKSYYVKIDAGVFVNASGESFAGINDTTTWTFATKSAGPAAGATALTVAADGTGDFDTVQGALDFVPPSNTTPVTIRIRNGTYNEIVGFQSKNNITIVGENVDQTVITYANNNTFNNATGVYHRGVFLAQNVTDFAIANLTIRNATPQGGTQAEALVINGSSATASRNIVAGCKFFSYQDTVLFNKQTYITDTYIEGDVDFMWGDGPSYFENCDIRILRTAAYFTQIRNDATRHGFVYNNCRFTAPSGITGAYLGRIDPRPPSTGFPYSEVVIVDSSFGDAANNDFLASAIGVSGANYAAGWWLFNNVTTDAETTNIRYWVNNITDAAGLPVTAPYAGPGSVMPGDLAAQANYRDAFWVLNTNIAGGSTGTWTPALAPVITKQPVSQNVALGAPVTLSVTAIGIPAATYVWKKNGVAIPGATAATHAIAAAQAADNGAYTVDVTCGSSTVTSSAASLNVSSSVASITTGGYSGAVTGGAAGTTVTVSTAADLKANAESAAACTIIVAGTIDISGLANNRIKLKSNKTLRGADTASTILGTVEISDATNVIVSNLTISADIGAAGASDGISIDNSTNVLVTKCTIFNCTDGNLDICKGSDLVTVSWCKFYYTRNNSHNFSNLVGSADDDTGTGPGQDGLGNYRITWHHNWWADGAMQRMIACRFGSSHMFNNYWSCSGNDYCTESRNIAAIFSEYNYYKGVKAPLGKRTALPNDAGLLMTLGNVFDTCTGAQSTDTDKVFTPAYSYHLDDAASVPAIVMAGAGNVAVNDTAYPEAAITNPAPSVNVGASVTLTAAPAGFTPVSYQWRHNNKPIAGATSATLALTAAQAAQSGAYTVVLGLSGGGSIVSAPHTLTVARAPGAPVITGTLAASASTGAAFTYNTVTSNLPATFTAAGLPSGLQIDPASGAITGTPAASGTFNVTITASNASGVDIVTLVLTVAAATTDTVILNDSFADGERVTQDLPASAAWRASTNATAATGSVTVPLTSSRTILAYFTDASDNPVSLAPGESLKFEFIAQFSGFDTAATDTAYTFTVGMLRSVANPVAADGTGFIASGSPNTNARVTADYGSSNPGSNVFSIYTGYSAFTRARNATNDTPVSFRARNISNASLVGSTSGYTAIPNTETPVASSAMDSGADCKGTFTLTRTAAGGMTLSFTIVKASDDSVVMTHTTAEAAATFTEFDTIAFYFSKAGGSADYYFILKNAKITKTGAAPSGDTPVITTASLPDATQNAAYTTTVAATNSPTGFTASGLPAGLAIAATGIISGTPTVSGSFNVGLTASNTAGAGSPVTLPLIVNAAAVIAPPIITSSATATAYTGVGFTYTITGSNSPTGFAQTGLPASLALNATTGVISGTAVSGEIGSYNVTLTATNSVGASLPFNLALSVEAPPALPAPVASAATGVTTTGFVARWEAVTGATGYRLDVSTDSGFAAGSFVSGYNNLDTGAANVRVLTGLNPGANYHYRVRAYDVGGDSDSSNTITVLTADTETVLVDDPMNDTDRIGGQDGHATHKDNGPSVNAPTAANTQWIANRVNQLVASASGLKWNFDSSSAIVALGYFPNTTVYNGQTVTIKLNFTTGALGGTTNNLRFALLDDSPVIGPMGGRRKTDGFSASDDTFYGDRGYGFFTVSDVGGASTTSAKLTTYKRAGTTSTNILGATGDWTSMGASPTLASGNYFQPNTSYTLTLTLTRETATSLAITSQITGGNFSGVVCTVTDASQPVNMFNTLAMRFGGGYNQFSFLNFTSLKISTTGSGAPTEAPAILSALIDSATRGAAYTYIIDASNVPTRFTAAGLPAGLELDELTGIITGTPANTGTYDVVITATNAIGGDQKTLVLHVTGGGSEITTVPATGLSSPASTVFDASGNSYVADIGSGTIKKVAASGTVTTIATIPQLAVLTSDAAGNLYTAGNDGSVRKVLADGTVVSTPLATGVTAPGGIAVASDGTVYVSKINANTIVKITSAGAVSTLAGSGSAGSADGIGSTASFNGPTGLALAQASGKLYIADTVNCLIREINLSTGAVTTVAGQVGVQGDRGSAGAAGKALDGTLDTPEAITIDSAGLLYIADTGNNLVRGFDPVSGALITLAGDTGAVALSDPAGISFDASTGLLHVADTANNALRVVTFKPVVASLLNDQTVALGSSVTLRGAAWASPDADYQWYQHGQPIAGATSATLTVAVKTVTDSGIYTVAATNIAGSGTSSMRLTVSGNNNTPGPNSDSPPISNGGGGGGAPSLWLLGAMALLACIRKINTRRGRAAATLLAVLLSLFTFHASPFAPALLAQQTSAAGDNDPGEVVTMSAFEVTAASVKGYTASESVTGTRVASLLRDLPFNVNVITSEYISDFNALELADQLSNVSSFSPSENIGQYQLRGFQGSTQLVDGFRRVGLTGVAVTDRVEVIKGPAASIYGAIQPGGAINTLRKKPSTKPVYGLTVGVGTDDQVRGSFYASGPLGGSRKLFYRVDTEYRAADRQQEFTKTRTGYAAVQLAYKPTARTTIGLFIDYADRHDNNTAQLATTAVRLSTASVPSWFPYSLEYHKAYAAEAFSQYFGMDYNYYDYNLLGPNATRYSRLTAGSLTLDHKFSDAWSLRASFNMSTNPTHGQKSSATYYPFGYAVVTGTTAAPPQAEVRTTPQHDEGSAKATGIQIDNLFRFETGPVKHQFLVTLDYYRNSVGTYAIKWPSAYLYDPANPYNTNATYRSWDYPTYEEAPSTYTVVSDNSKVISRDYGLFLSERATMLNGRLIAMVGARYDYVDSTAAHKPSEDTPIAQTINYAPDAWTYQAGITGIISRNISVYANASTSFDPQPQLDEYDNPLPNIESDGYEFGLKLTLLSDRLNITLNRFHIRQKNVSTSVTDPDTSAKETILTGEQIAKGYELDFNWQATRSLNFIGGYGYVDSEISDAGKLNWLNGTTPRRVPKHNLGISVRYEFTGGPLKGLFTTAGVTYYSKSLVNLGSGKGFSPHSGSQTVSEIQKKMLNNLRFENGGLPYPFLPENASVTFFDPSTKILYWTDNPTSTDINELKKYSYANPYMDGKIYVPDGRTHIYNRSSIVWKAGIGYKFKTRTLGGKLSHKIQINMDNVFDEQSTTAGGIPIMERNVMVTYSVSF